MISIILALLLDLLLGDPYNFPHPVVLMGKIISIEEGLARRWFKSEKALKLAGLIIITVNMALGFFIPFFVLKWFKKYGLIFYLVNIYLIYTCIAARSLAYEGLMVRKELEKGLPEARARLAYIVGRDTSDLSKEEVIKACLETLAENTADGVIAPLLFIFLLGVPGGFLYKFINTMDSMLGYKNEKYKNLGYFPAKLDDIFNYLPARITGFLMNLSAIGRFDYKKGFHIMFRDRKNHDSPNAAYPEAAVAGLLGIQLGGDNFYQGILVKKPTIGDNTYSISPEHIDKTIEIIFRTELFFTLLILLINYI